MHEGGVLDREVDEVGVNEHLGSYVRMHFGFSSRVVRNTHTRGVVLDREVDEVGIKEHLSQGT